MILKAVVSALVAYATMCLLIYLRQGSMLYYPGRSVRVTPADVGLGYRQLDLRTADGERLHAWAIPARQADAPWVLFSHGNAGTMSNRLDRALMFHRGGVSVLLYDYRGFGASTGRPSEGGLRLDAQAAWRWLVDEQGVPPRRVVLLGESLGGGVTAHLASLHRPGGMILESTFTSAVDLGTELAPWLPVRLLARDRYPVRQLLAGMDFPKLFLHSPQDEVIPYRHGQALFEAAPEPKAWADLVGLHDVGLEVRGEAYARPVLDFVMRVTGG